MFKLFNNIRINPNKQIIYFIKNKKVIFQLNNKKILDIEKLEIKNKLDFLFNKVKENARISNVSSAINKLYKTIKENKNINIRAEKGTPIKYFYVGFTKPKNKKIIFYCERCKEPISKYQEFIYSYHKQSDRFIVFDFLCAPLKDQQAYQEQKKRDNQKKANQRARLKRQLRKRKK